VPAEFTRIISDLHCGDRASRIRQLAQLRPLFGDVTHVVFNGDTLDTRPGPAPEYTAAIRAETLAFIQRETPGATLLTGNHDADISSQHTLDLNAGKIFVIHGDILFDNIVPWGNDARLIGRLIAKELAAASPAQRAALDQRLQIWRRVAAQIPQRHQSERHSLKYALRFAADTVWPPLRVFRVMGAWREGPPRAAQLLREHRPWAKFVLIGHTHRPGFWRMPDGVVVINTGSFTPPLGGFAADISSAKIVLKKIELQRGEFRVTECVAEFPLATG
jgi:predicted phosphodiesterase